jgi:hypothetical protein
MWEEQIEFQDYKQRKDYQMARALVNKTTKKKTTKKTKKK